MRIITVLALLCCCYAAEQTTPVTQQEGRLPPQHIKDFVEQHIKHVKQQIPLIQQQIKEGKLKVEIQKPKVNDQQVPENIKEFIKEHITKILQYIAQQKRNKQLNPNPTLGVPLFVIQKIEKLKKDVKDIVNQTETHIPQVIKEQIAHKNQIKDKQQNTSIEGKNAESISEKEKNVVQQIPQQVPQIIDQKIKTRSTRSINYNIQQITDNEKNVQQHVPMKNEKEVASKPIVKQANQNIPLDDSQYVALVYKREVQDKPTGSDHVDQIHQHVPQVIHPNIAKIDKNSNQEKPVIPVHILGIVEQIHQHVPQVLTQHFAQLQKKDGQKASIVSDQINKPVTLNVDQNNSHVQRTDMQENPIIPSNVQGIVQQNHQHVPQVISQNIDKKINAEKAVVPNHIQGIVEQVHQHVPQVVIQVQKKDDQTDSVKPDQIQIIKQHILQGQKEDIKETSVAPDNIQVIVRQNHQQVPQVINQHIAHANSKETNHIQGVVQQNHQHAPQVVSQHVAEVKKKEVRENPVVPSNIEGSVQQLHQYIPQVINHDKNNVSQAINKIHPVVEKVEKLTHDEVIKNTHIEPSRSQQLQNQYNISPVRTNLT